MRIQRGGGNSMSQMMTFVNWFIEELPDFLMSDAIKPLWGLLLAGYIIRIVLDLRR